MADYIREYEKWLASPAVDAATKDELRGLAGNDEEIKARFGQSLSFGTAGLRGLMRAGTNAMNVYTVRHATQGVANVIKATDWDGDKLVVIACDSRNNSELFSKEAAAVLAANGIKACIFDELRPTPELSFALRELKAIAGINITASHNPKEYNGYKAYWDDGAQLDNEKAAEVSAWFDELDIFDDVKTMPFDEAVSQGLVKIVGKELDERYLEEVLACSVGSDYLAQAEDYMIVYTPFHGAGYKLVPEILRKLGFKSIIPVEEQMIPDGDFPTVKSPNPENTEGFALAIEYARRYGAELVIGTDPDSDRCGAAVKTADGYQILSGNQIACLMLDYLLTVRADKGTLPADAFVVKSIVSTVMANKICETAGVRIEEVLTGFRFIGSKIKELQEEQGKGSFVFGFEESLGYLPGAYARDKDAVAAAMLMAEVGCYYKSQGLSVYEGLQKLYEKYGYYIEKTESKQFEGNDAKERMASVMEQLRSNTPSELGLKVLKTRDYLDGYDGLPKSDVLFYELEDGCAAVVRPSGTEPKVKCYVMAQGKDKAEAESRKELIKTALLDLL